MSKIYSAIVYRYDKSGNRRVMYVNAPCTCEEAAYKYAKVLKHWWGDEYSVTVEIQYPVTLEVAKRLEKEMEPF